MSIVSAFLTFFREISWKEFVAQQLSRGNVERLEVVNNKWVKASFFFSPCVPSREKNAGFQTVIFYIDNKLFCFILCLS
jgi:hypothetical protein